jgi:capsular exopolysaccharide synthesis family protein
MNTQDISQPSTSEEAELSDYLRVLRDRKWIIIATTAIVVALAVVASLLTTPKYSATAQLLYQKTSFDSALFGSPIVQSLNKERDVQTGAHLVKLDPVAERARESLLEEGLIDETVVSQDLLDMLTVEPEGQTDVVRVSAVSDDPDEAAAVASAFANEFVEFRREADTRTINAAEIALQTKLDDLATQLAADNPPESIIDYANTLQEKLEDLGILKNMQNGGFEVVQDASVPPEPFSPQPVRNGILAAVLGLMLGVGLAFLFEYLDKRIKDEQGMEQEFGLPVLASVPVVGGTWRKRRLGKPSLEQRSDHPVGFPSDRSPLVEPFRTLRSNLQYFNVDRNVRVILVTSGLPQQGKTVTSINLGLSLALSGERVVVIEADLRRPMLHTYLGLSNEIGVSSILAGSNTFAEAMQLVQLDEFVAQEANRRDPSSLSKNMYCITSGPLPPNPAELAGSLRMQEVIDKAAESADFVLVDSPPLLLVADGLSLAKHADGVIIATLLDETTRDEARQMMSMLRRVGANPVGIVAGGAKESKSAYRKYGYYHSEPAAG